MLPAARADQPGRCGRKRAIGGTEVQCDAVAPPLGGATRKGADRVEGAGGSHQHAVGGVVLFQGLSEHDVLHHGPGDLERPPQLSGKAIEPIVPFEEGGHWRVHDDYRFDSPARDIPGGEDDGGAPVRLHPRAACHAKLDERGLKVGVPHLRRQSEHMARVAAEAEEMPRRWCSTAATAAQRWACARPWPGRQRCWS